MSCSQPGFKWRTACLRAACQTVSAGPIEVALPCLPSIPECIWALGTSLPQLPKKCRCQCTGGRSSFFVCNKVRRGEKGLMPDIHLRLKEPKTHDDCKGEEHQCTPVLSVGSSTLHHRSRHWVWLRPFTMSATLLHLFSFLSPTMDTACKHQRQA